MRRAILLFTLLSSLLPAATWRQASESELKTLIPARAPVEKERIETEFRTASGITNGKSKYIAGVVLITAGYAADGKYSHFLIVQAPLKIGSIAFAPGDYVFGYSRKDDDSLDVKFYDARSGKYLGNTDAKRLSRTGRIESFRISPPVADHAFIEIGRFGMSYSLD